MRVTLHVESGPGQGKKAALRAGESLYVGRFETANLVIAGDAGLSNIHFALEWGGEGCRVRDLNSGTGTFVNDSRVTESGVRDGDRITAGKSSFFVRFEEVGQAASLPRPAPAPVAVAPPSVVAPVEAAIAKPTEAAAPPSGTPAQQGRPLLDVLRAESEPLFALLDAARDVRIFALLQQCQEERQSLYEGTKGERLALVAPYLVRLPPESPLPETIVREGWGKSWGVWLTSRAPFPEVRRHFRRFLLVQNPEGKELYFRFYDPRVLRVYLPTCTMEDTAEFFGPIGSFLLDDDQPEVLLRFASNGSRARVLVSARRGQPC